MSDGSRRRLLRAFGCTIAATSAGCWDGGRPTTTRTETTSSGPTETGTDLPTETPTESPTPAAPASVAWSATFHAGVELLTLGPERLYAEASDGRVVALRPGDGVVRWRRRTSEADTGAGVPPVSRHGDTALLGSVTRTPDRLRGALDAVDPETGERRWTFGRREFLAPVGAVDDTLFVAGHAITGDPSEIGLEEDPYGEGKIHALDVTTGEHRLEVSVPGLSKPHGRVPVGAAVAGHGIYVYEDPDDFQRRGRTLRALDLDGEDRWQTETGTSGMARPIPFDGGVLSGADGNAIATFDANGDRRVLATGWAGGPSNVIVTDDGLLVDGRSIGEVATWGQLRWLEREGGTVLTPVAEDTVYVDRGGVFALDRREGTPKWIYRAEGGGGDGHTLVVLPDGRLVGGQFDSFPVRTEATITLLDGDDGEPMGDVDPGGIWSDLTVRGNRLFVASGDRVRAFDVNR